MIYEFIATITAGFGMAGLALIIRHLSKLTGKSTPKWLIPLFAALGILGFQIHQEYNWSQQQINRLPEKVEVVKKVEGNAWYRPWSYLKPQVVRFMAVSQGIDVSNEEAIGKNSTSNNQIKDEIKVVDIYLFERRMSTKVIRQYINCSQATYRIIGHAASVSAPAVANKNTAWYPINKNDDLFIAVCS